MSLVHPQRSSHWFSRSSLLPPPAAEVVLCLLLSKFTFAPSDKPVFWNMSAVRFPTVGTDPKPSLPLRVGLYKPPEARAAS